MPLLYTLGILLIWLTLGRQSTFPTIRCGLVLLAFSLAVGELARFLNVLLRSKLAAAALSLCLACLWLTWPIWLSHALQTSPGQRITDNLVPVHPLLVINGVLPQLGVWSEHPIAYHLTNIGQDISYTLPHSILPCLILHLAVAGILAGIALSSNTMKMKL
jgi:hypothetical protein